jgi:methyl-accepting chemotaxis protein
MNRNRKFKNLLINPSYQLKYVLWINATGLVLIVLYSVLVYHYVSENYAILVDLSPMNDEAKTQLYSELKEIILRMGLVSVGFLGAVSMVGVLFSHRTAGPLYHFKKIFSEIRAGNRAARVKLRPKDDFQDVAQAFNDMMDQISEKKP